MFVPDPAAPPAGSLRPPPPPGSIYPARDVTGHFPRIVAGVGGCRAGEVRGPGCRSEHRSCGETRHGCVRDLLPGEFSLGKNGSWSLGSFSANEVSNTGSRSHVPGRMCPGKAVMLASCVGLQRAARGGCHRALTLFPGGKASTHA